MNGVGIEIAVLLRRVVIEVFGESARVEYSQPVNDPHIYRARVLEFEEKATDVGLELSYEWFSAWILDLHPRPNTIVFFYDEDEEYQESLLRALAVVLRSYARGEGRVEYRPSLFRRRPIPCYILDGETGKWMLSHRVSVAPFV